jgi:hypothetical protein
MKALTAVMTALSLALAACGAGDPATPPGIGDSTVNIVVPQSQQQAQDTVYGYLKRTLDALPPGTVLDATPYGSASITSSCDDNDSSPTAPRYFSTHGQLKFPAGTDNVAAVAKVGDIWRSWGWRVIERDGFRKPNQFGYGPDGYRLQVVSASPTTYPPTMDAISPCYPGSLARNDIAFPIKIASGG